MKTLVTFVGGLGLILSTATAFARRTTVTAQGHGVVAQGGTPVARAQAMSQALRDAVGQVARSLGGPGEGDDSTIDHAVYDRAASFVPTSRVLNEDVDGTILTIEASFEVDADALKAALGGRRGPALSQKGGRGGGAGLSGKRVLILATEQLGPHQIFGWTDLVWTPHSLATHTSAFRVVNEMGGIEATLSEGFSNAGFSVVDPHVLRGKLAPKPAFEALDLSTGAGQQIAQKSDADLVIIAKGTAQLAYHETIAEGGMKSGQGNVVARLVRVRDGKVLASTTQHAAQVHIDADTARLNALNEAARLAADALTKKLNAEE
jgi:hypothetical protein